MTRPLLAAAMALQSLIKSVFYRLGFSIKRVRPTTSESRSTGRKV
jgi:hypothetical protein